MFAAAGALPMATAVASIDSMAIHGRGPTAVGNGVAQFTPVAVSTLT
jgi:hypothetical protein